MRAGGFEGALSKGAAESNKIGRDVRQKVEDAIERLSYRVTTGDVAATAGVSVFEAEQALRAIAADTLGTLNVSSDGEILYVFPTDFKGKLRSKSLRIKLEPLAKRAGASLAYLTRVSFGTALIASIVIVGTALVVVATSSQSNDRDRGRSSYRGGGRMFFSPLDFYYPYWDPYYYRTQQMRRRTGEPMNFLEGIFSFVFGDGDQNYDLDDRRWSLVGDVIKANRGVVTCEQILPYLDVLEAEANAGESSSYFTDESYMIPVLQRFDGQAQVDAEGNIVYCFPELQKTAAVSKRAPAPASAFLKERRWTFSKAGAGQKAAAIGLGILNVALIVAFNNFLSNSGYSLAQISQYYGGVVSLAISLLPGLKVYAAGFFLIPAIRAMLNISTNKKIEDRNAKRYDALRRVQSADPALRKKLQGAKKYSNIDLVSERTAIFSSQVQEGADGTADDYEDFDRRLQSK